MKKFYIIIKIITKKGLFFIIKFVFLKRFFKFINLYKFNSFRINPLNIFKINKIFNIDYTEYQNLFSNNKKIIESISEQYINKKFYFLGANFNFNDNIDWHYDPKDNKRWIIKKYDERKIHYSDSPKDVKIVWELNRHQYFFTLAKAYKLTNNSKYAECIISHILSWIKQNQNFIGINWSSSLEVSIRLISWICALDLIEESEIYKKNQKIIFEEIYKHIIFLKYNLSDDRLIHTNHLIGELTGLILACIVYNFPERNKFLTKSLKMIEKELKDQVFQDGVSKEQSASYHRFVIDFITLIVVFSKKFNIIIPNTITTTLEKMIDYVSSAIINCNNFPIYGDSDNGRGFIFTENNNFWDFSHVLSNGIIMFRKNEYQQNIDFNEESFWLFGTEGLNIFKKIKSIEKSDNFFYCFEKAGHYVYKNSLKGIYFFVRGGVFGMGGNYFSSHSHFDLLSPILSFYNLPFLIDSGTYVYNGDNYNRNKFRESISHNNITWNKQIVKPKLNFGWEKVCNAKIIKNIKDNNNYILKFIFENIRGYEREFILNNECVIINDIFSNSFNNLYWHFHLHPNCKIIMNDSLKVLIENQNKKIYFSSNKSELRIIKSEVSFNYGEKEENFCIVLNSNVNKNEIFSFFLSINDVY